jgi:hypothetical protein
MLEADMTIFKAIKDRSLMNADVVEFIVDRLNLEPFYEFMVSFNKSNDLPYHNLYHSFCVFLNCYEGCYYEALEQEEARGLCAAALLHDFNHSGGRLVDSENIQLALQGLEHAQIYASSKLLGLSPLSLMIAQDSIQVTQFPFIYEPQSITQKIIRDADLMQPYEDDLEKMRDQFLGLKVEMEIARKTTYTRHEFATGCKTFQDAQVWHTNWAIEKAEAKDWEERKLNLQLLLMGEEQ